MKITAMLLAAAMLAGCASTSTLDGSNKLAGANAQPDIDRCMWIKPRCRAK
ncbi:hypothetical protein [Croceicoccus marinus]|uniref:hypothetical protein n=1 Tax=Croceicoccus marinus TaxID=450378 RepID=UPI000A5FF832|nr:hypothetical protein [Croceicoccus marinus]